MNVKAQIALVLLLSQSSSINAQKDVYERLESQEEQKVLKFYQKSWFKPYTIGLAIGSLLMGGIWGGSALIGNSDSPLSPAENDQIIPDIPPCITVTQACKSMMDRRDVCCSYHEPSYDYWVISEELAFQTEKTNGTIQCTPACNWVELNEGPYLPIRAGTDTWPSEDERKELAASASAYQYALCNKGSFIKMFKTLLARTGVKFWSIDTPGGEGILYPEEYNPIVFSSEEYNHFIREPELMEKIIAGLPSIYGWACDSSPIIPPSEEK